MGLMRKDKSAMIKEIEQVDGVKWALGLDSVVGTAVPDSMIPDDVKPMLKSDNYELEFICSDYKTATPKVDAQIDAINNIVKSYSKQSMVIGEAPLTKDLETVTDTDFRNVNILSILAIFIIIMINFKSISLPIILVAVIEFAIFVNMGIPYFTHTELPFVASIVIGTIQLGAYGRLCNIDDKPLSKRAQPRTDKLEAVRKAHSLSMKSILISGMTFFAATFGVSLFSKIDMINSICTLLARGAVISTLVVVCVLPALLLMFDKVIVKTSYHFLNNGKKVKKA